MCVRVSVDGPRGTQGRALLGFTTNYGVGMALCVSEYSCRPCSHFVTCSQHVTYGKRVIRTSLFDVKEIFEGGLHVS